jgi:hypothetical protein
VPKCPHLLTIFITSFLHVKEKPPAHSNDATAFFEKSMDFMKKTRGRKLNKKTYDKTRANQRILATKILDTKFASLCAIYAPSPRKGKTKTNMKTEN